MSVCNLGFFSKEKILKKQNLETNLNFLAVNLKNNILRSMAYASILQGLKTLTNHNLSQEAIKRQKRSLARMKLKLRKRRATKRLELHNRSNLAPFPKRVQRIRTAKTVFH